MQMGLVGLVLSHGYTDLCSLFDMVDLLSSGRINVNIGIDQHVGRLSAGRKERQLNNQ